MAPRGINLLFFFLLQQYLDHSVVVAQAQPIVLAAKVQLSVAFSNKFAFGPEFKRFAQFEIF